jgi:hypothetical protein
LCLPPTYKRKHAIFVFWERKGKRRKLRRWIGLMYFLLRMNVEFFNPVEITIRRKLRQKREK